MNKAVFLDRDGVINKELDDYAIHLEDFEILPDVAPALAELKKRGYLLIIISNQGGIGKDLYTIPDVELLHASLLDFLDEYGVKIEEIYYCVHHPLTGSCLCRKPDSLMVEKAIARFNIDVKASYFIGDKERDILAGQKVGVKGILIEQNTSLLDAIKQIPK